MGLNYMFDILVQFNHSSCLTVCDLMDCSTPGFPVHHQLPELAQTHVHRGSDAIEPSSPLFVPFSSCRQSLPKSASFPMSQLFAWRGQSIGVSASASVLLCSGLISFRMGWLDLLAVQGTLKSLLQHHSSKTSILQHSAFFIVKLSHAYMTTGKTIALTRWTFVVKVMFLLFNALSRLVIAWLPRSKCLLISWLLSSSAVIWEPKTLKFHCLWNYLSWSVGTWCYDLSFLNVEF